MIHFVRKHATMNDLKLLIRTAWQLQRTEFIYDLKPMSARIITN